MDKVKRYATSMFLPILFIVFWQISSIKISNPVLLPKVNIVTKLLINPTDNLLSIQYLLSNTLISIFRVAIGYILAAFVAIPIGMIVGYSKNWTIFYCLFWVCLNQYHRLLGFR